MPCPQDILKICGSLVRIDQNPEGRNSLGERAEVQTLTAAHASVIDFLKEESVKIGQESEVVYTRAAMNLEMAETCLVYLVGLVESEVVLHEENISNYPLARFSAELWDDFYREVVACSGESDVDMTRVNALVMRLFASREKMLKWIQLCDPDYDTFGAFFDTPVSYVKSVMYYAALLGLPDIVSTLIKDGHSVEEKVIGSCGTPLVAACVHGRANVASILLDNGADPNLPGNRERGCPIAAAIEQDYTEIVGLLLKTTSVDVNARRFGTTDFSTLDARSATKKDNESLLYIAARCGSLEMVNALQDAGADPNIQGGSESTPLQVACCVGSVDIVETLLRHGANANSYGGYSGSPLQAACACPSLQTVKILVGVPVDVNYVGKELSVSCLLYRSDFPTRKWKCCCIVSRVHCARSRNGRFTHRTWSQNGCLRRTL